jgi:hypothetical protein
MLIWTDPPRPKQSVRGLAVAPRWTVPEQRIPRWLPLLELAVLGIVGLGGGWILLRALDVALWMAR